MGFSNVQVDAILKAFTEKIKQPCPACAELNRRQLVGDVFMIPGGYQPVHPMGIARAAAIMSGTSIPPTQIVNMIPEPSITIPALCLTCTNCGFTEFYNIHVLGLANVLNIPTAGNPLG